MTSNKEEKEGRIEFKGVFTDEIRKRMRDRRVKLGLPYQQISQYFNVDWSTYRKWELGTTLRCSSRHFELINAFINGELDETLKTMFHVPEPSVAEPVSSDFYVSLNRMANAYLLCSGHPKVAAELLEGLEQLAMDTLQELIASGPGKPKRGRPRKVSI